MIHRQHYMTAPNIKFLTTENFLKGNHICGSHFSSTPHTCRAGLSANKGVLFTIWAAIFGSAANACNIDCVYGAESIFCISCGFSIICCIRLCIPGELRSPDGRVLALLPPVPPVSPPAADQGFGRGSRFSCPCWGFVPSEKVHPFPHFILELTVQF